MKDIRLIVVRYCREKLLEGEVVFSINPWGILVSKHLCEDGGYQGNLKNNSSVTGHICPADV